MGTGFGGKVGFLRLLRHAAKIAGRALKTTKAAPSGGLCSFLLLGLA
jgi:hypothetical protein